VREKECLKELQKGANWAIWCKANPKDKGKQGSVKTADASSQEGVRSPKVTVNTKKEHHEEGTSQELEAGGNGEMCKHARLILTWSAGYIMTPSLLGPPKGFGWSSRTLSKKGAAVTADSPINILASVAACFNAVLVLSLFVHLTQ